MSMRTRPAPKEYLVELSVLLNRDVQASELSSPAETQEAQTKSKALVMKPLTTFVIPFTDKSSARFRSFIQRLNEKVEGPVRLFTPYTLKFGFVETASLLDINFEFPFNVNRDGILSIVSHDVLNSLLLDFFVSDAGVETLEVELEGSEWQVAY
jgi:hypothetical protein